MRAHAPSRSVRPRWTVPLLCRQPTNEGLISSKEGSNIPIICVCSCCTSEVEQQVLAAVTDGAPDKRQPWVTSDLCLSLIVETHVVYAADLNSWRTWCLGYVLCLVHCRFLCCLCVVLCCAYPSGSVT